MTGSSLGDGVLAAAVTFALCEALSRLVGAFARGSGHGVPSVKVVLGRKALAVAARVVAAAAVTATLLARGGRPLATACGALLGWAIPAAWDARRGAQECRVEKAGRSTPER